MADIAKLKIAVDSKEVKVANQNLDKLERQSGKTEKKVKSLGKSSRLLSGALLKMTAAVSGVLTAFLSLSTSRS